MNNEHDPAGANPPKGTKPAPAAREDRLKAALKANMARRKAQARARAGQDAGDSSGQDKE